LVTICQVVQIQSISCGLGRRAYKGVWGSTKLENSGYAGDGYGGLREYGRIDSVG